MHRGCCRPARTLVIEIWLCGKGDCSGDRQRRRSIEDAALLRDLSLFLLGFVEGRLLHSAAMHWRTGNRAIAESSQMFVLHLAYLKNVGRCVAVPTARLTRNVDVGQVPGARSTMALRSCSSSSQSTSTKYIAAFVSQWKEFNCSSKCLRLGIDGRGHDD